jgi:hypothetical protein
VISFSWAIVINVGKIALKPKPMAQQNKHKKGPQRPFLKRAHTAKRERNNSFQNRPTPSCWVPFLISFLPLSGCPILSQDTTCVIILFSRTIVPGVYNCRLQFTIMDKRGRKPVSACNLVHLLGHNFERKMWSN